MRSEAQTVEVYMAELSPERRALLEPVLEMVRENLPEGYEEEMAWGMITWVVPLSVVPETYNGQPLAFGGLASQKNYASLYLTPVYAVPEFKAMLDNSAKKLKIGKGCINFTRPGELPLDVLAEIIRRSDMQAFIDRYHHAKK